MKKYLFLAIVAIGGLAISCTTDNDELTVPKTNLEVQEFDYSLAQKDGDTLGEGEGDTGGQGGSTPIKP